MARGLYRVTDAQVVTFTKRLHALETRFLDGTVRPGVVLDEIQRLTTLPQPFLANRLLVTEKGIETWWVVDSGIVVKECATNGVHFCNAFGASFLNYSIPYPGSGVIQPERYLQHPKGILVEMLGRILLFPNNRLDWPVEVYEGKPHAYGVCPKGIFVVEQALEHGESRFVLNLFEVASFREPLVTSSVLDVLFNEPREIQTNDHGILFCDGNEYVYYSFPGNKRSFIGPTLPNAKYTLHDLGVLVQITNEDSTYVSLLLAEDGGLRKREILFEKPLEAFISQGTPNGLHLSPTGVLIKHGDCIINCRPGGGHDYVYRGESTSDFQMESEERVYAVTEKDNTLRVYGEEEQTLFDSDEPFSFVPHHGNAFVIEKDRVLYCQPRS